MQGREIVQLETGWAVMQKGIEKLTGILEKREDAHFTAEEYMNQYTMIYDMCTQRAPHEYSEQLYERYKNAFVSYLGTQVRPRVKAQSGPHLLKELSTAWANQEVMVRWLSRFFNYLDRYYVGRHNLPNLQAVGLNAFRDEVYAHTHEQARDAMLELIAREREHEHIDRELLRAVLSIFTAIGVDNYKADFEQQLLAAVHAHYKTKAVEWIETDSCAEYLVKAEACLQAEEERAASYLHEDSKAPVVTAVQQELLEEVQATLIEKDSGCSAMLRDNKTADLERMFALYSRCGGKCIEPIAKIFQQHVHAEGVSLVNQCSAVVTGDKDSAASRKEVATAEQAFIKKILELQDKYLEVVKTCFAANASMHKALRDTFESFCNKSIASTSTAELLATFADLQLRKGEKLSEEEVERTLEKVVKLLVYINDRDIFAEFHRKKLAKRLLSAGQVDNAEESFLQRLKSQYGAQFISKMEGMCSDLNTARAKQQDFTTWLQNKEALPAELDVKVLTTGFWPSHTSPKLVLPEGMAKCVKAFEDFYTSSTKHRNITWMHNLGNVVVKAPFRKETKELVLQPVQAAMLMLFNAHDALSVAAMMDGLNLDEEEAVRTVSSFAHGKVAILQRKKAPDGGGGDKDRKKKPGPDAVYSVNWDFTDKLRRVKVPMPIPEDKRKVVEEVQKDRKQAIDAAIVRIMKSRQALEHSQLVPQVMQQVRRMFAADNKAIKGRIAYLIDQEYLKRDENNQTLYRYLA